MIPRVSVGIASCVVIALGVVTFAPPAAGDVPSFRLQWTTNDGTVNYDWTQFGTLHGFGSHDVPGTNQEWTGWRYEGGAGGAGWEIKWDSVFNNATGGLAPGGAFVTANIVVTNNDVSIQNFSLLMTLATGTLGAVTERGSVVGTVTDLNEDDATVFAPTGSRIYTPMIDGAAEAAGFLMVDPFSQNAGGTFQSSAVGPADFGIPVPLVASQSVDESIGILLDFDLTPGDTASFTSIFEVIIPAPGVIGLLAVAAVGTRRRRRR